MNDNNREITDVDREEILRLVLSEAEGTDVGQSLGRYPRGVRSQFRKVVCEAGLVKGRIVDQEEGEARFDSVTLTERGRRRLKELNERRERR